MRALHGKGHAMKTFDWADLLRHHPIFSTLDDKRVRWLLSDEVSVERTYPPGTVILEEGEVGDSIFLIGSGSIEAVLSEEGGEKILLAVMRKGEIFGEMAFFEGRPRSATIRAREPCTVLEAKGPKFRNLVDEHPDIEFKLLLKVSERLRYTNEQILALHVKDVDEKLRRFGQKLDAELKAVDASLKAAHTVFDQTKLRTDEVIQSAERARTRVQAVVAVIGLVSTVVLAFLGFMGWKEIGNIRAASVQTEKDKGEVQETKAAVAKMAAQAKDEVGNLRKGLEDVKRVQGSLDRIRERIKEVLADAFRNALRNKAQSEAERVYRELQDLDPGDLARGEQLLGQIEDAMLRPGSPYDWEALLKAMLNDAQASGARREEIWTHYLLLANAILAKPENFEKTYRDFEKNLEGYKRQGVDLEKNILARLSKSFAGQQKQAFDRVSLLVSR